MTDWPLRAPRGFRRWPAQSQPHPKERIMAKKEPTPTTHKLSANPRYHQQAPELQSFGTVSNRGPLQLEEPVRLEMTERLNQLLADTMTLRDLYKKSHWQVSGPTFYQ